MVSGGAFVKAFPGSMGYYRANPASFQPEQQRPSFLNLASISSMWMPILLPRFFGLDGVLCSFPAGDVLTFILTVVVILKVYRELSGGSGFVESSGSS